MLCVYAKYMTRPEKETRYLLSIPGMKRSIQRRLKTPVKK